MANKKDKKEETPGQVNEPQAGYVAGDASKTIRFFSSFEEMNEADHKEMGAFTPIERLQHITEFIKHAYAEELKNPQDFHIYFK